MKIKYLWLLNILDEMRSENLNHTIDKEFYDWTDYKSIDWLYENAETGYNYIPIILLILLMIVLIVVWIERNRRKKLKE